MCRKFFFFFSLAFFCIHSSAQLRTESVYIQHNEHDRSYELFVPDDSTQKNSYRLLFVLHGGGGTARQIIRHTRGRFNQLARNNNFIVVYPSGIGKSWNDGDRDTIATARKLNIDDVGFIEKIIKDLQGKLSIDEKNIFICGISNGGFMAQRIAIELPAKINAIGVVAANLSVVQAKKLNPENPVSLIFINGTRDPLVPYHGGYVEVFRQQRGKVLSVEKSIENWRKVNGCSQKIAEVIIPDKNQKDDCIAIKTTWKNPGNPQIKMVAVKIENGGHTWPGTKSALPKRLVGNTCRDFNGCEEIWSFFESVKK